MTEILIRPLADAFMQVGVFVALLVAPFGWARYRWGHRIDAALERYRDAGPFLAALLTMPPGCGGAIIVMALYARGAVSFGAAVAALVATMGDATWVLLASDPMLTIELKGLLLVTGTVTGYVVDGLRIAPRRRHDAPYADHAEKAAPSAVASRVPAPAGAPSSRPLVSMRSDERGSVALEVGAAPGLLWLLLGAAAVVSVPTTFQLMDPALVGASLLGGVDPYLTLGTAGTLFALFVFVRGGCKLADDDTGTAHPGSMAQMLRHGGQEVAFVTVWVAVAYLAWSAVTNLTGFDGSQLPLFGLAGVLVGAFIGLIPGCGVQIVFTGIFVAGGMPLSTFAANTISQDGDALLPLLALETRSAFAATVITTVPAVVVGSCLLLLT